MDNSTSVLNSLISPLTINNSITIGKPSYWGNYIEADTNYLFSTDKNDFDYDNTTTLTLKNNEEVINQPVADYWTLTARTALDKPIKATKNDKEQALISSGDRIKVNDDRTATIRGSTNQKNDTYANVPHANDIIVKAKVRDSDECEINIRSGGGMESSDWSQNAFDGDVMHFNIKKNLFQNIINNLRTFGTDLNDFKFESVILKWQVDNRPREDLSTVIPHSVRESSLLSDGKISYDPSILDYDFSFFNDAYSSKNIIHAGLEVKYSYTTGTGIFKRTKKETKSIYFGGFDVDPLLYPPEKPDEIPNLEVTNQIQNITNSESNSEDGLAINNVKKDDEIQYVADFKASYADGTNDGQILINKGVYTVPIPKGIKIDDSSFEYTDYYSFENSIDESDYKEINSENINIQDDPNDDSKQILTVNNLSIQPTISGDTARLQFSGQVENNNRSDFSFTPSFKGIGGYEGTDTDKPLYVESDGQEQLINFQKDSSSGDLTVIPEDINFGSINSVIASDLIKYRADDSPVLSIQDERNDGSKNSQTISVQQKGDIGNGDSLFPGELRFYDPSGSDGEYDPLLDKGIVPIYVSKDGETLKSISWENDKGLLLYINGNNTAIPSGKYTTTLSWTISDTL